MGLGASGLLPGDKEGMKCHNVLVIHFWIF